MAQPFDGGPPKTDAQRAVKAEMLVPDSPTRAATPPCVRMRRPGVKGVTFQVGKHGGREGTFAMSSCEVDNTLDDECRLPNEFDNSDRRLSND